LGRIRVNNPLNRCIVGGIIKAVCACGFETDFMGGSGRQNVDEVCYAPALCPACKIFLVENYMKENPVCPKCDAAIMFYDSSALQAGRNDRQTPAEENIAAPGLFILPRTSCFCPKCEKMTMKFIHTGCWG